MCEVPHILWFLYLYMTVDKLWKLSFLLLFASFTCGRFAIFTNGGNGNANWYLSFWFFSTNLFFTSGLLLAKYLRFQKPFTLLLTTFFTVLGLISSSPLGLMTLLGLPILVPFGVFVIIELLVVKAHSKLK